MPSFASFPELHEICVACSAGGRGVIEGLGKQLSLPDHKLEPSFASLYWYGNTSSASTWYGLSFIESVQRVRAGERVWQVPPSTSWAWHCREADILTHAEDGCISQDDSQGQS